MDVNNSCLCKDWSQVGYRPLENDLFLFVTRFEYSRIAVLKQTWG